MTRTAYHQEARNVCHLCGSDDLQKADDLMAALNVAGPMMPERYAAIRKVAREASALRAPHFNRECVAK